MRRMRNYAGHVALFLALVLALPLAGVVSAQSESDTPTKPTEVVVIEHDGWQMELPGDEPLVVYVREATDNLDGSWVLYTPFAREADGSLTALTACDDVAVTCVPVRTRADKALDGAGVGDALILAMSE